MELIPWDLVRLKNGKLCLVTDARVAEGDDDSYTEYMLLSFTGFGTDDDLNDSDQAKPITRFEYYLTDAEDHPRIWMEDKYEDTTFDIDVVLGNWNFVEAEGLGVRIGTTIEGGESSKLHYPIAVITRDTGASQEHTKQVLDVIKYPNSSVTIGVHPLQSFRNFRQRVTQTLRTLSRFKAWTLAQSLNSKGGTPALLGEVARINPTPINIPMSNPCQEIEIPRTIRVGDTYRDQVENRIVITGRSINPDFPFIGTSYSGPEGRAFPLFIREYNANGLVNTDDINSNSPQNDLDLSY